MYQVIIVADIEKKRRYYESYVESENVNLGNISCTDLPPYQDINRAHACYWNDEDNTWIFDQEKYNEIIEKIEAEKAAEAEKDKTTVTMTNEELTESLMELADIVSSVLEKLEVIETA